MASGVLPFLSPPPAPVSSVRWPPAAPRAGCPWRTVMVWDGSGVCSFNKLMLWLDLTKLEMVSPCSLCCHGGRRGVGDGLVADCCGSAISSEMGLRRWIRSRYCCSVSSSISAMCCKRSTAPSAACSLQKMAAGLNCSVVDLSGRRAAYWSAGDSKYSLMFFLPASMPDGRQSGYKSASVALFSCKCRRRSDGEVFASSGSVPGGGDFGPVLEPCARRTRLQFAACVQGLLCKVPGLACNLLLSAGPWVSCTEMQK